ncbi:Ubiquitin carboxyl-terminal hydrolase family protein [Spironucleus salmonicida]|uniref:Ubiquitin carboxyl-terminal hydrolase family protein n=1 Tax=Spironucleus salmonicida TaxID=348837 RepID=V6LCI9_9EUKA|nr:Ubiquitin carboxyl-terminal hydrolase family protein [Spironucleus salmonicida]|eukprot:EST41391.1 Ubiquitin carboxyl-terminal hydrolase family protein [Spironucleus salmonicida]
MENILVPLQRLQSNQPLRTLKFVERYIGDDLTNFQQEGLYKIPKHTITESTLKHAFYIIDPSSFKNVISTHKAHPQFGFQNTGASCYANTVLQALFSLRRFRSLISSDYFQTATKSPLLSSLTTLQNSKQKVILPQLFYANLKLFDMSPLQQSDATELLLRVIDAFHFKEVESANQPQSNQTTAIEQLFGCVIESKIVCQRCKGTKNQHYISRSQLLPISKTLKRSFQEFLKPVEITGYNCEFCGKDATIFKYQKIIQASSSFIIQLQRWNELGQKVNKNIEIPEKINLTNGIDEVSIKTMSEGGQGQNLAQMVVSSLSSKQGKSTHQLKAVICHSGVSLGYGHYFCYCYSNGWQVRDDEIVQKVNFNDIKLDEAVMLIYEEIACEISIQGVKIHDVDNSNLFEEKIKAKNPEVEITTQVPTKCRFVKDELMDRKELTSKLLHSKIDEMDAEIDAARRRKTQKMRDANRLQRMDEVSQRRNGKTDQWRERQQKGKFQTKKRGL